VTERRLAAAGRGYPGPVQAVLCDRDGTLVVDVPYNGDPDLVFPLPGVRSALRRLRENGIATAVVTNQRGIALGHLGEDDVRAVNRRVDELLGPFDWMGWCPHDDADGCGCRKPAPGLVHAAAHALGVAPSACVVVGDTGADVGAALAAGARAVLVPNGVTLESEVRAAPVVAGTFAEAVDLVVSWS
jgi:D-glycero-D-manno-heptose 1,7-bisphosphate phosphatase